MGPLILGYDAYGLEVARDIKKLFEVEELRRSTYPQTAFAVAKKVVETGGKGILICKTGLGMCICANKITGAYACVCYRPRDVITAVTRNDCNILCIGSWTLEGPIYEMIALFLTLKCESVNPKEIKKLEEELNV